VIEGWRGRGKEAEGDVGIWVKEGGVYGSYICMEGVGAINIF
jgi:hypothetical protein